MFPCKHLPVFLVQTISIKMQRMGMMRSYVRRAIVWNVSYQIE